MTDEKILETFALIKDVMKAMRDHQVTQDKTIMRLMSDQQEILKLVGKLIEE